MSEPSKFEQLGKKIGELLPDRVKDLSEDMRNNFNQWFHTSLSKMDILTREEFEVQRRVLERSREKLEQLEARVGALEAQIFGQPLAPLSPDEPLIEAVDGTPSSLPKEPSDDGA